MEYQQSQEFKTKIKVSNPLNDIAANLGVTPKVLTQLATGEDQEFRELVRGIFSILPENEVALVAADTTINPEFLDYLSRLFEDNPRILLIILHNPATGYATRQYILEKLPEDMAESLASNPKTPPDILRLLSELYQTSPDLLVLLMANPATPEEIKELILAEPAEELTAEPDEDELPEFSPDQADDAAYEGGDVDAKIALCVDKLYQINADIVTEYIKKARFEILKRLKLIGKANRVILNVIVQHPSLTIADFEQIDLEMFASLLKKSPEEITTQTVLALLQQAKKNSNYSAREIRGTREI